MRRLIVCLLFWAAWAAAGDGVFMLRDPDRLRVARQLYQHSFENKYDTENGRMLPDSADYDANGWPDFWEPILGVGFPEYLINSVTIVPDDSGAVSGMYRDMPNRVLRIGFDGTRVGLRTHTPVAIDPMLSYEFSLLIRDEGLQGARIRVGVEWMRVDSAYVQVLRADEIPNVHPGQTDWPVTPLRMLITDPPANANAARLFIIVDRQPGAVGGGYHGAVWFDNVTLRPYPKIIIDTPRLLPDGGQIIPVRYDGLIDNIPDPDNPGFFKGRRYFRRVEITDVYNQPVGAESRERKIIEADENGQATEEMIFPRDRYGVYYFNIRLYDAEGRLATDVMRAVAVMRPPVIHDQMSIKTGKPNFGIATGPIPQDVIRRQGALRDILIRSGVRSAKLIPWPLEYSQLGGSEAAYSALADEMRGLRTAGMTVYGVIDPPPGLFGDASIVQIMEEDGERLSQIIREAGRRLGLYMDGWQWGGDDDGSLYGAASVRRAFDSLIGTMSEYSGGLPMIETIRMHAAQQFDRFPVRPAITQTYLPETESLSDLWNFSSRFFPWLYEPYFQERGRIYPPRRLAQLAPPPAADQIEAAARMAMRSGAWITLESAPSHPHEPNAATEGAQLEQMLKRAIYAAITAPEIVFVGELFEPSKGLLRRDISGDMMLETIARPSFLAAGTLVQCLEGAEYLGQLGLLQPFEAHVFRRPESDEAVIALWHNDTVEQRRLARIEIANGPPLMQVDWAGNSEPLPASITVRRVPIFITGLSATLALTRMSVRINPTPPILALNRGQQQVIEVVNHMIRQAPVLMRLRYAARQDDGAMESGWTVIPEELRANLPPVSPMLSPGQLRYSVSPDPNSTIQIASPNGVDKLGSKIAQVAMTVQSSQPAEMLLYLPYRLQSDLDVDVEYLARNDDPHFVTLQLKIRWFPSGENRRRGEIRLVPFYMKRGQSRESHPFPVTVKALPPETRSDPNAMFEAVELRIPRTPHAQTWVGLLEENRNAFYLIDVTDYLAVP